VATIKIPKKTKPVPKPKRKPGTRAGLTKSLIAAAAVTLIDSAGMDQFSVRKLATAMGVGPTSIHAHFKGGTEAVLRAVAVQALAGTTRPFKPMEEPAEYLRELLLRMLEALHARPVVADLVVLRLSSDPILDPLSVYSASKAAIRNFARGWILDLAARKIRVNVLSPGATSTPGWHALTNSEDAHREMIKFAETTTPLGRLGDPDEIASAALFLASDESSFVTGIELFVDGGSAQI
jgi:NAD(P)-dependent dehydrogenase (short-subunit alcohol dehydrogenase family)